MTGGTVLVLGPTGRNFAAGMSGGTAFVLDLDSAFGPRVNLETVALEDLDEDDRRLVIELCERHLAETGSAVAARFLERPDDHLERVVKVMPKDYRRVLEATRRAIERGEEVIDVIMAAAHG
jgi:glutamate synthase (NADPH/NADH) large chain